MLNRSRQRGFIRAIVLVIVALVLLKYFFNITFYDIVHSQVVTEVWSLIKQVLALCWQLVLIFLDFLRQLVSVAQSAVQSINS